MNIDLQKFPYDTQNVTIKVTSYSPIKELKLTPFSPFEDIDGIEINYYRL